MNNNMIGLLRKWREVALTTLAPLDYVARVVNGKKDLPPLHLRRYVGPLRSFESSGAEFMGYLQVLAGLRPEERVLDIGCGCGQMALHLKNYLNEKGSYAGVDIHQRAIKWCQKKISSAHQNFQFTRIDVRNRVYNPEGLAAETYRFTYDDGSFDLILLKSVFTHMRPEEVSNYISEVARLLKPNGRSLVTFFLLNDGQAELARKGMNNLGFNHGEGVWRYVREYSPESAVAYDESFVMRKLAKNGLKVKEKIYGSWSGRKEALSYQDILLVEKASGREKTRF